MSRSARSPMSTACTITASPRARNRIAVSPLGDAAALEHKTAAACLNRSAVARIAAAVRS